MEWSTYELGVLFLPTAAIFFITAAVCLSVTRSVAAALTASLIKAGLFLFYFSMWFDGTYNLLDDFTYARESEALFAKGVGILTLGEDLPLLLATANGPHFLYYLYNVYAIHLFGAGYFAPVALNTILSVFIAYFGAGLAEREFGFIGALKKLFFLYLVLFPDLLAWSGLINDKDILVLFLHVVLLYGFSFWFQHRIVPALVLVISASFLLLFLRFYVPLFFSVAFAASMLVAGRGHRRLYWFVLSAVLIVLVLAGIGQARLDQALTTLQSELVNPAYGMIRFLLTPIPLNTTEATAYLDLPAAIHWLLIPFAVFGGYKIYQLKTPFSRFFLVYFMTFVGLYSMFGELQGPRHRVQLDFALAVFQFAGVLALVRDSRRAAAMPVEPGRQSA